MKKDITLGQLLSACSGLVIAIFTGWITLNNKVSEQNVRIHQIEIEQQKVNERIQSVVDRIEVKMDKVNDKMEQILIQIQNKQDRK